MFLEILNVILRDPAKAHEVIWSLVGLALGVIAALTIVIREILHGIAACKRAKQEYFPKPVSQSNLSVVDSERVGPKTVVKTRLTQRGPIAHNRRNSKKFRQRSPLGRVVT
jgi:hypothetical protein